MRDLPLYFRRSNLWVIGRWTAALRDLTAVLIVGVSLDETDGQMAQCNRERSGRTGTRT